MTDDPEAFFEAHCKTPGGILLVFSGDEIVAFSSLEKAKDWMKTRTEPCVVSPHIIDEPDFGNVPREKMN